MAKTNVKPTTEQQTNIGSVVLCGGAARRMGGCDKPLQMWREQPLVAYVLRALPSGPVVISANRSIDAYQAFGCPVVADANSHVNSHIDDRRSGGQEGQGPLAGIVAAAAHLSNASTPNPGWLYVVPGDAPKLPANLSQRFVEHCLTTSTTAVCAKVVRAKADRLHPLPLLVEFSQLQHLPSYLAAGKRSVRGWLESMSYSTLTLAEPGQDNFANVNTPQELADLNRQKPSSPLSD